MARFDAAIAERDVLAERKYEVNKGNDEKNLVVKIAYPIASPEGDFVCMAEIGDSSCRVVRAMRGRDGFEAIFVALKMIGTELTLFTDVLNDRFTWEGADGSGLRFPIHPDYSLNCIHQQ